MCSNILLRIDKRRHILQTFFFKEPLGYFNFSVFSYSSDPMLINKYVCGNHEHCVIKKVRNYHNVIIVKAAAAFPATKLEKILIKRYVKPT